MSLRVVSLLGLYTLRQNIDSEIFAGVIAMTFCSANVGEQFSLIFVVGLPLISQMASS